VIGKKERIDGNLLKDDPPTSAGKIEQTFTLGKIANNDPSN